MRAFALRLGLLAALAARSWGASSTPPIEGRFDLRDASSGARVTQESYQGRYRLVFFGYTHCPLTCPLGLHTLSRVLSDLGPDAKSVAALFITIDPARDKADVVRRYLAGFDPRITGLVGGPAAIAKAMRSFRLEAERVPGSGGDVFEHPAIIYVMDRRGHYVDVLPSAGDPATLAARLRIILKAHGAPRSRAGSGEP